MISNQRVTLLILLTVSLRPSFGQAEPKPQVEPIPGVVCVITSEVSLFKGQDGDQQLGSLVSGTRVTLNVEHSERWMVEASNGTLGFLSKQWMKQGCQLEAPAPKQPTDSKKRVAPDLAGMDVLQVAAALDVTKAVAEGSLQKTEAIRDQLVSVSEVSSRRDLARAKSAEVQKKSLVRIAVYDLELMNLPAGLGTATTEAVLEEVRKLEGVSAIGMDEVREMIDFEAQRQSMGCEADSACLAEIAGALGVDEILVGKLSEQADARMIVLKRIDQVRAEVRQTFTRRLHIGNGEEFLLSVGEAIEALYPLRTNRPGTERGVREKAVRRLNPPPLKPWWTLTAYGLSAAAMGAVGLSYWRADMARDRFNALDSSVEGNGPIPQADWRAAHENYDAWQSLNHASFYTAGGLMISSVIMTLLTDWVGGDDND